MTQGAVAAGWTIAMCMVVVALLVFGAASQILRRAAEERAEAVRQHEAADRQRTIATRAAMTAADHRDYANMQLDLARSYHDAATAKIAEADATLDKARADRQAAEELNAVLAGLSLSYIPELAPQERPPDAPPL